MRGSEAINGRSPRNHIPHAFKRALRRPKMDVSFLVRHLNLSKRFVYVHLIEKPSSESIKMPPIARGQQFSVDPIHSQEIVT
ncbi:hypothetical protein TNCT_551591 [Trichonephila clavata]|uniref:Uncharacterized protein n=1 Tax=Trichonephila clavata TaxID=2740835 RepID=A0A8X6GJV7_TRICU|nr:hypothetical protein TNCT_551591 [Trichonephila clavata]